MRLEGWAWLLCALSAVAARKDSKRNTSRTDLLTIPDSTLPLRRSPRAICSQSITVTPDGEIYWLVGEVHDVWCSVVKANQSNITAHNLAMFKNTIRLPHQVVNESTIHVTMNLTEPEEYKLYCEDSNGGTCMTTVKVGFPPPPVEDLQCVSHNWNVFSCNWTLPDNPAQNEDEDYLVYLVSSEIPSRKYTCDCNDYGGLLGDACKCPNTCCMWSGNSYFSISPTVVVMFVAENELGRAAYNHTIDNYAVVLPDAMSEVSVETVTGQREAVVRWTLPPPMGTFAEDAAGVMVRVDHRLAEDEKANWTLGELLPCHADTCKNGEHNISLEYWWRSFQIRVRLRSAAAPQPVEEDGWWSDWQPLYVKTPQTAPDTPPAVGPGTFQVTEGLSDLTFTWSKVPELLHNGSDFGYLTQVCGAGTRAEQVLDPVAVNDSFVVFQKLTFASPFTLRVAARNSKGSGPWAEVHVDPWRPTPPLLPVVVEHVRAGQDTLYELRWQPGGASNYTVYLCAGEQEGDNPCTGQLAWTSVGNASAVNLTLQKFGLEGAAPKQVTFAVSEEDTAGASSGLSWDRCGAPQPYTTACVPPSSVIPLQGSSWVELQWSLDYCYWAGVVEGVEATYCPGTHDYPNNCTEERKEVTGEVWAETLTLEELEAGVQYTAWLRIKYRSGASPWSESVSVIIGTSGVEAWLVVVAVVIGILATVVISFGLLYSKRKFVDNLKKLRLQPSLPTGLVPVRRQECTGATDGEGVEGGVPVNQNTVSASVRNPGYSHILPTVFGRRPSLPIEEEEENRDVTFDRGVTQANNSVPSQQQQQPRSEADDNFLNTPAERGTSDEGTEVPCGSSGSTSEPLLQGSSAPNYVTPYFSESESEGRDVSDTKLLLSRGYVSLPAASSGGSQSPPSGTWSSPGGSDGYVPPSECAVFTGTKTTSGYVTAQHGDDIGAANSGYVQADAIPHAVVAPDVADVSKSVDEGRRYVALDFPMMRGGPARSQDPTDLTHDPITRSQDSPAPSHDPGVLSPISVSLRDDLKDDEPQIRVEKPNYVSFPDAQLNMEWVRGDHVTPSDDKLDTKESVSHGKVVCPPSDAPAPGYIAVQPPDFGKPAEEGTRGMTGDFISTLLSKPDNALRGPPRCVIPTAFPAITPGALDVPSEAHKSGNPPLASTSEVNGYVPFPLLTKEDKNDLSTSSNSWFSGLMPFSRTFSSDMVSEAPTTGISFILLSNLSSIGDKSGEPDIKESEMNARSVETDERVENEAAENETVENEDLVLDLGYSRVGEPPEDLNE